METPFRATVLLATCAGLAAFCAQTSADGADVPSGTWGGEHIVMEVAGAGATVEFDCAHGTIDGTLTLDSGGRFDVAGSFTPDRGGPNRRDEPSRAVPLASRCASFITRRNAQPSKWKKKSAPNIAI